MIKREKVKKIITFFVFIVICVLSVLSLSMFISGYLALILSGGALGFSVIWLIIYANRKYGLCKLQLPIFPLMNRTVGFVCGVIFLIIGCGQFEPDEFESLVYVGGLLGVISVSLFSRTLESDSRSSGADGFWTGRRVLLFFVLGLVVCFILGFLFNV